jgi:hypothetical protein
MSGQEGFIAGVVVMVALGFLYRTWLWFKDGVTKMFRPQSISLKTKETPWQIVSWALLLLTGAFILLVMPTCIQEPNRCSDALSVTLLFLGSLGQLIVAAISNLGELALTLLDMARAMLA